MREDNSCGLNGSSVGTSTTTVTSEEGSPDGGSLNAAHVDIKTLDKPY